MKEVIVVWLISMDLRKKNKQTKRYHKNDRNSNGIGLVMWREEQATVGQPTLITTPRGHLEWEPRKTKDEMEG